MQLIDELRAEHDLIERVLGSLRTFVAGRAFGVVEPADGTRFMRFFRLYAGAFHHGREEETLFAALVERAHLPQAGPIATLLDDHHRMAGLLAGIEPLIAKPALSADEMARLDQLAKDYSGALWHHIDAENSVLLPEAGARLRKKNVLELASRAMTGEERAAMEDGRALVAVYAPMEDPAINRGDGCVCCPAFVEGCRGIEREWWNDWEWAEFEDHLSEG